MKKLFFLGLMIFLRTGSLFSQSIVEFRKEDTTFFFIDEEVFDSLGVLAIWDVNFQLGSYHLVDSNDVHILAMADYLLRHPTYCIELGIHTDCRGSKQMCSNLSQRRAQAICERLVELGVDKSRLIPKGYGDSVPIMQNGIVYDCAYITKFPPPQQQELHAFNRRIQVLVISK